MLRLQSERVVLFLLRHAPPGPVLAGPEPDGRRRYKVNAQVPGVVAFSTNTIAALPAPALGPEFRPALRRRIRREPLPVGNQAAGGQPLAALAEAGEIAPVLEARRAVKPQALWR